MSEELGKIEKPEVESYKQSRKLFLVPLIFATPSSPDEYRQKYDTYWQQTAEQVRGLEQQVGRVNRVYHEAVAKGGDEGLEINQKVNLESHRIAHEKVALGAVYEATEDGELASEAMDWERCLIMGLMTETVFNKVNELYQETSRKRYEHIRKSLDETLKPGEVGIIFLGERHPLSFPSDIEVFSVSPPALDEINRYLRDRAAAAHKEEETTETS